MIISFTGAQSTGKTTLLNNIRSLNPFYIEYVAEVTRRIKREFNLPINESGGDLTQTMIMSDHIANVYQKYNCDNVILDRCALDGIVYTQWLYNKGKVSKEVLQWAKKIYNTLIDEYDVIFVTSPADVPLVDDGERSVDKKFREEIIDIFDMYIDDMKIYSEGENVFAVEGTVEERMKYIKNILEVKGLDIKIR
jgi:nicotinamide riboside kinase